MAKQRKSGVSASSAGDATARLKPKRTRKSVPRRECPSQRTSVYRGVTRHRWTGRFEAHLWDKNTWSETQRKKKGRQIYLGAYGGEEAAARAYDLAALKYWGRDNTILNFPLSNYDQDLKEMEEQSREEYIGSLRRTSTGFSRGVSKFRGVARHHHNGKWEARIGRVFGNKYLYLGTYGIYSSLPESSRGTKRTREQHQLPTWSSGARGSSTTSSISTLSSQATIKTTQEEAAMAYDMAAIEHRGLNAVTNFDVSRYIKWHHLCRAGDADGRGQLPIDMTPHPTVDLDGVMAVAALHDDDQMLQSPGLKEMIERAAASESSTGSRPSSPCSPSPPAPLELSQQQPQPEYSTGASSVRCSFPDDVQTYFGCEDHDGGVGYAEVDTFLLGDLGAYAAPMFQFELDV